jgi:hypothetical protein
MASALGAGRGSVWGCQDRGGAHLTFCCCKTSGDKKLNGGDGYKSSPELKSAPRALGSAPCGFELGAQRPRLIGVSLATSPMMGTL